MSRKWERMVRKNQRTVNTQRKKQGKSLVGSTSPETTFTEIKGRNWPLAAFLLVIGTFSLGVFLFSTPIDASFIVTALAYIFLGLIIYFFRRPNLKVFKKEVASRRFGGERRVDAEEIESIQITPKRIVIQFRTKKKAPWVFSKVFHLFNIDEMKAVVLDYATRNGVKVES